MGLFAWLQDCWIMMMRTKPQYISVLGRKRSSIRSPHKLDKDDDKSCKSIIKSCVCLLVMICSVSYGVLLLLLNDESLLSPSNMLVPLVIAGIASLTGGVCLSEYMSTKPQEVPSVYSCCYQYSSEVLAFFVGWSWLLSQAALVAAFCRLSAELLKPWTEDFLQSYLHQGASSNAGGLLGVVFVLGLLLLANTGLGEGIVWFVFFVPVVFVFVVVSFAMNWLHSQGEVYRGGWFAVQSVDQILHLASLCTLFFSGPQSVLRLTLTQVHPRSRLALGPLNGLSLTLIAATLLSSPRLLIQPSSSSKLIASVLCVPCALEALRQLFFVLEDMACDGLLFRGMAKKGSPCCAGVPAFKVQGVVGVGLGCAVGLAGVRGLVVMAVVFPLAVNSVVPYLVLLQRYRDNTSWQYEPMFQTTARTLRDRSRRRSEEHQYTNGGHHPGFDHPFEPTTTCIDEEEHRPSSPSSSSSSEEDIDSVVQQYRDQAKIANMATMDEHDPSDQVPEPTPVTARRAKVTIGVHFAIAAVNAGVVNCGLEYQSQVVLVAAGLAALLLTTVVQAVLLCFPQNKGKDKGCCSKVPRMPWVPGVAAFVNKCLFVNAVVGVWPTYVGWISLGLIVYFGYGIRSSTAANSFYNFRPAHIALCPLPSYGNKCVTQVVPSQRKKSKTKLQKKSSNSSRRKPIMA